MMGLKARAHGNRWNLSQRKPNSFESSQILNQLMEIARISALAEMASGIAHELNQPLGAIATFSQAGERMLNRPDPLVDRAAEVFRQINHEALSAGDGIRRIRRLFDQEQSTRVHCDMSELICELRPVLDMVARGYGGELQFEAVETLPALLIDRLRIQHVVFSLVQNAFDASVFQEATPLVTIAVVGDRYGVETSISDLGTGISSEVREKLFRPFFTTKPQGTGLGLASSRAIIEAHEGTIGFDSPPAGGSRFWFRLPYAERAGAGA
jgi:C4-dicarboxylate-specific signal transduction histidine kinase